MAWQSGVPPFLIYLLIAGLHQDAWCSRLVQGFSGSDEDMESALHLIHRASGYMHMQQHNHTMANDSDEFADGVDNIASLFSHFEFEVLTDAIAHVEGPVPEVPKTGGVVYYDDKICKEKRAISLLFGLDIEGIPEPVPARVHLKLPSSVLASPAALHTQLKWMWGNIKWGSNQPETDPQWYQNAEDAVITHLKEENANNEALMKKLNDRMITAGLQGQLRAKMKIALLDMSFKIEKEEWLEGAYSCLNANDLDNITSLFSQLEFEVSTHAIAHVEGVPKVPKKRGGEAYYDEGRITLFFGLKSKSRGNDSTDCEKIFGGTPEFVPARVHIKLPKSALKSKDTIKNLLHWMSRSASTEDGRKALNPWLDTIPPVVKNHLKDKYPEYTKCVDLKTIKLDTRSGVLSALRDIDDKIESFVGDFAG